MLEPKTPEAPDNGGQQADSLVAAPSDHASAPEGEPRNLGQASGKSLLGTSKTVPSRGTPAAVAAAPRHGVEILLIFAMFAFQGAWPVPDVNETHYLGKAAHYWNPRWVENDFFLDSPDTHHVFYFTFGWLALWLELPAMAWVGRVLTWGLLAWSWQRLSVAVVPHRWFSVFSGALFAYLVERGHMSGEWVIGGVEAKGFAYVLVFLGLEALVRDRWNRALLCFGGAACFHVLVGGWAAVAAGLAWIGLGRQRPSLTSFWPGLLGGLVLALPGLVPSLLMNWGTDPATVRAAHEIYVFRRLAHHLVFARFPLEMIYRFLALVAAFLLLARRVAVQSRQAPEPTAYFAESCGTKRLVAFVLGSLVIAAVGVELGMLAEFDRVLAAGWLRFYWFRLADVVVPLGVALLAAVWVGRLIEARERQGKWIAAVLGVLCVLHFGGFMIERPPGTLPRGDKRVRHPEWRQVCEWVAQSPLIPRDAVFLTPLESQTFKWRARRAEVVTRKDIPQDARSIVEWWSRLQEIHATKSCDPEYQWYRSLTARGENALRRLGAKYGAEYLLTEANPRLALELLYANRVYAVYRISDPKQP